MATTVSYSASMRTRKTNSASNAKSSAASQPGSGFVKILYTSRSQAIAALGGEDLTADLHCKRTKGGEEIRYARSRLVIR